MDSLFEELVAVNSAGAFNFFHAGLRDSAASQRYRPDELQYVASVLAHYAQTSRSDAMSLPPMANLAEVFDNFILQLAALTDSGLLEFGGSQILLFAGFFRDQMERRHNVRWYDQLGQSLYERAGRHADSMQKRELFDRLSETFPLWTGVCNNLSRTLRQNRFVLRMD